MADLSSKTTDGRLSFTKYVTDNKRYNEIEYEIEKGKSTYIFKKSGTNLNVGKKEYRAGTPLKILSPKYFEFGKLKFAEVKIGNEKGYIPISNIRKPTAGNGTQYEDEVVDAITKFILEAGGPIDIKLKGDSKIYKNILYAIKVDTALKTKGGVKGDPKADIILCTDNKNPLHKNSIFVSHKKQGGPEAFQQYGGVSEQAGLDIYNHPLTQNFLGRVAFLIGETNVGLQHPVMAEFNDKKLANMSIYGPDYGSSYSLQHVQCIGQGHPSFRKLNDDNYYELSFTSHMSLSGDLSHFSGGYTPVFGATFRAGRGFYYNGKRWNGARVGIYPKQLIARRSGLVTVDI